MLKLIVFWQLFLHLAACWSPTNGYAPASADCPSGNLLREANGLSSDESRWLDKRDTVTQGNLEKFLKYNAKLNESDFSKYLSNDTIRVGLAFSGGGFRAMLSGAGQIAALDNSTDGAAEHGLGGLLESSTYLAGLSGGNWLVGSLAMNNWTSVQEILSSNDIWDLTYPISNLGGSTVTEFAYFKQWMYDVSLKLKAGFDTTFIDVWGRALSTVFFKKSDSYGSATTWSTLQDTGVFKDGEMPFPILVADLITNEYGLNGTNSTVFETNPFEFGTWDPTGNAFTRVKYLGSTVDNGEPQGGKCVLGYDNAGFIMGTSSALFNQMINATTTSATTKSYISQLNLLSTMSNNYLNKSSNNDTYLALYGPNPFLGSQYSESDALKNSKLLTLADGGEDGQGIPLVPLLQEKRNVDVIFAFDNSGDTEKTWPNASSLQHTYDRQFSEIGSNYAFPYVPPPATFLAKNYTNKPVFFGCDAKNLTALTNTPPVVVYIANRKYSFDSNTATLLLNYTTAAKRAMVKNGFETTTRNNLTGDANWATCVGCAIIRRSQERANDTQSEACKKCFQDYCWNGEVVETYVASNSSSSSNSSSNSSSSSASGQASASASASPKKSAGISITKSNSYMFAIASILAIVASCA